MLAAEAGAVVGKVVDARVGDPDPVTAVRDALQDGFGVQPARIVG